MIRSNPHRRGSFAPQQCDGFTLVELLTVLTIIAVLASLATYSITSMKNSRDLTRSAYLLTGVLEQARTYAVANDTYTWVGFYEEDGSRSSTNPGTSGVGRLVVSEVASEDGTRYSDNVISTTAPEAFGTDASSTSSNKTSLIQLTPLLKLNDVHMVAANTGSLTGNVPSRPAALSAYQVGDAPGSSPNNSTGVFALHVGSSGTNPTTFAYPLATAGAAQTAQYTFAKIIEFNPQGEASKIVENVFSGPGPQNEIEIALQPTYGNVIAPNYSGANQSNASVAIQVEGLSGQVRMYRQ